MKTPTTKGIVRKSGKLVMGKPKHYDPKADKLAHEYSDAGDAKAACEMQQTEAKEKIFALVSDDDASVSEDGKTFFKVGDTFKVGFTNVMTSPGIDHAKLLAELPKSVVSQFMNPRTVYDFDEAKFIQLVETEVIDKKLVAKCTVPSTFKHKRIVVEKLKK